MIPEEAASIAVFVLFAAYGFMGAWDGLLRHRIRIRLSEQSPFSLTLTGGPAFIVGTACLLFLLVLSQVASAAIPALVAGCDTPVCALERVAVPPFTNGATALVTLVALSLLMLWAPGMLDGDGPFRTRMLAPGVWYRERDIVTLVQTKLHEHRYDDVDVELILDLANMILRVFHGVSPAMTVSGSDTQPPTHEMVIAEMRSSLAARIKHKTSVAEGAIIIEAIALYTMTKLEAAERRWPWRRRFLEMFP